MFFKGIFLMISMFLFFETCTCDNNSAEAVELVFVGDVSFARNINAYAKKNGDENFLYSFNYVKSYLKAADIAFCNLETPLSERGSQKFKESRLSFRGPPTAVNALVEAGISIVSLANNHCFDFGIEPVVDTQKFLNEAGIKHIGLSGKKNIRSQSVIFEIKGRPYAQ